MVTIKAAVTVGKKPYNSGLLPPTTSFQLQWSVVVVVGVVIVVVVVSKLEVDWQQTDR